MKKKIVLVFIVFVFVLLGVALFLFQKKGDIALEEVAQSSEDIVVEEAIQLPVDTTYLELLEKMKIVKNVAAFEGEFLGNPCDKYQAYEMLNTMKGQDGAEVPDSYAGHQITQKELLALYMKELFQIEVTEAATKDFEFYADELKIKDYFRNEQAAATNNNLISLAYACTLYGLDNWENVKTVFQQMLESGFFNGMDITTFENEAMDDIFNYGTNKCPATEINDEYTGRTYYFVDYFGNCYNSRKNMLSMGTYSGGKEILLRPYFSQQNITADGTSFLFTRYPSGLTYLYNVETQTMKYIDTVHCGSTASDYMYLTKSDTLYYFKKVDGKIGVYRKDLKSEGEPEKIVDLEGNYYYLHVTNDEKYASIASSVPGNPGINIPFIRIDIENKKVEVVKKHSLTTTRLPGNNNIIGHIKINPVYPELFFFAHDYDSKYLLNCPDRVNIMNVDTGEVITVEPGIVADKFTNDLPARNIGFTHESWSENGEYLYITNLVGEGTNVPRGGMIRVDKDGTHRKYITHPGIYEIQEETGTRLYSGHAAASGDDRYCVLEGHYMTLISQETNQIFPISYDAVPKSHYQPIHSEHPYHAHPTVSRGSTYLVNWGYFYVPPELIDNPNSGTLGVAWFDFTSIDENEVAKGGEVEYNEYVSRLSYEGIDCESETGTFFGKEAVHVKAGNFVYFNIETSIVDSVNDTVTITFDYYDNNCQDMKLIYTKAVEEVKDYDRSEDGSIDIVCTNTNEWKKAEVVVHGNFETSGKYGTDFKIGSTASDIYITNVKVKKN